MFKDFYKKEVAVKEFNIITVSSMENVCTVTTSWK